MTEKEKNRTGWIFRNMILDERIELKNRFTHLRYEEMIKGGADRNGRWKLEVEN